MDKAVILARGLGTRMRNDDSSAELSGEQAKFAGMGVKAMIPIERPFLDYVISALADAGYRRICLVVGAEHGDMKDYYQLLHSRRVSIEFAVQDKPLGTADAVASAEAFAGGESFAVINSDNYYPVDALRALRELDGCGLIGFEREAMLAGSNIEPERITRFAIIETDEGGHLKRIIEKPSDDVINAAPKPVCLSMNCWRFGPSIFEACRAIEPSPRGELELPDAVQYSIDRLGEQFSAIPVEEAVLDMTSRKDVASVADKLLNIKVEL